MWETAGIVFFDLEISRKVLLRGKTIEGDQQMATNVSLGANEIIEWRGTKHLTDGST